MSAGVSTGARRQLDALAQAQPESAPWLTLVGEVLRASEHPAWDRAAAGVALRRDQPEPLPLLAGATMPVERGAVDDWVRRLLAVAAGVVGTDAAALHEAAHSDGLNAAALLEASINQDERRLDDLAAAVEVEPEAIGAVAQLTSVPLLQACRRRLAPAIAPDWDRGCCPVCGFWPALTEVRGLERARRLRCGRCGGDWGMVALRCPFCGTNDHQQLGSLVPAGELEARRVETCARCRGYLKTVTTLRAWAGDEVGLADLATVELDLAALERGFARPTAPAVALDLRLVEPPSPADGAPGTEP